MMHANLKSWLRLAVTTCASPFVAILPIQAANFSFSGSTLLLENFSQTPISTDSVLTTDAASFSGSDDDIAFTDFDGSLDFSVDGDSTRLEGEFEAFVQGLGTEYLGRVEVGSEALASFDVEAETPFSFEFTTSFLFNNVTDGTPVTSASALTDISLLLLDSQDTVLSFFDLTAGVNTNSVDLFTNDFLQVSTDASLTTALPQASLGNDQEIATAVYSGVFQQTFDAPTQVRLVAQTRNQACAQAPGASNACVQVAEPSNRVALTVVAAAVGMLAWRQRFSL